MHSFTSFMESYFTMYAYISWHGIGTLVRQNYFLWWFMIMVLILDCSEVILALRCLKSPTAQLIVQKLFEAYTKNKQSYASLVASSKIHHTKDHYISSSVQDCSISSALVMEILQFYTKPLIWQCRKSTHVMMSSCKETDKPLGIFTAKLLCAFQYKNQSLRRTLWSFTDVLMVECCIARQPWNRHASRGYCQWKGLVL